MFQSKASLIAVACAPLLLGAALNASATTISEDFEAPTTGIAYNGNASQNLGHGELTPNLGGQRGSFWFDTPLSTETFSVSFDLYLGDNTGGADGITFAVIDTATGLGALGSGGGSLGYFGIPGASVAIEFDTWFNSGIDPNGNHVGADANGSPGSPTNGTIPILEDGRLHSALLEFDMGIMTVTLDGAQVLVTGFPAGAMPDIGYFGFTGGTGAARNLQYVDNIVIEAGSNAVPEPGTLALMGLALAGFGFQRRKG